MGYTVHERPFEFSAFIGRFAFPLFGGLAAFATGVAGALASQGLRYAPAIALIAGIATLFLLARWLLRAGVLSLPVLRTTGVNLEATAPGDDPSIWMCAHIDTKSQPVPTLVRTIGVVLESMGVVLTLGLAVALATGVRPWPVLWGAAAIVTLLGALPVVFCVVGTNSPGALDNASGVTTVLAAAREMRGLRGVGMLITDAEELALAGARAWARTRAPDTTTVLNCDGVDDGGEIYVMFAGTRPAGVMKSIERTARDTGIGYQERRLGLAILTDSVAFTEARIASVTFSRGTFGSLARVHSPRDDLAHLQGAGIAPTARLLAATARALIATEKGAR